MEIRVAGAQIPVTRDIQSNLATINRAIDYAIGDEGAVSAVAIYYTVIF